MFLHTTNTRYAGYRDFLLKDSTNEIRIRRSVSHATRIASNFLHGPFSTTLNATRRPVFTGKIRFRTPACLLAEFASADDEGTGHLGCIAGRNLMGFRLSRTLTGRKESCARKYLERGKRGKSRRLYRLDIVAPLWPRCFVRFAFRKWDSPENTIRKCFDKSGQVIKLTKVYLQGGNLSFLP